MEDRKVEAIKLRLRNEALTEAKNKSGS